MCWRKNSPIKKKKKCIFGAPQQPSSSSEVTTNVVRGSLVVSTNTFGFPWIALAEEMGRRHQKIRKLQADVDLKRQEMQELSNELKKAKEVAQDTEALRGRLDAAQFDLNVKLEKISDLEKKLGQSKSMLDDARKKLEQKTVEWSLLDKSGRKLVRGENKEQFLQNIVKELERGGERARDVYRGLREMVLSVKPRAFKKGARKKGDTLIDWPRPLKGLMPK